MTDATSLWIGFNLFVLLMLVLDLGVLNRRAHIVKFKEAVFLSIGWIALALLFAFGLYYMREHHLVTSLKSTRPALEFLTGYLIELSLSVDNLFVFLLLFSYFKVPAKYQHKVLFWGILGAIFFRLSFILAGVALIERFHWLIYIFGGFLIYTGIKIGLHDETEIHPENNPVLNLLKRVLPVSNNYVEGHFLTRQAGKLIATPMMVVLVAVETTDIVFAVDSIPAILAITRDPFLAYSSNVFAILGLRSLYFALSGLMDLFAYLNYGLAVVLCFIGVKMLLPAVNEAWKIPTGISLLVVATVLGISIAASLLFPPKNKKQLPPPPQD